MRFSSSQEIYTCEAFLELLTAFHGLPYVDESQNILYVSFYVLLTSLLLLWANSIHWGRLWDAAESSGKKQVNIK